MKRTKKYLAAILALAMTVALAACNSTVGGGGASSGKQPSNAGASTSGGQQTPSNPDGFYAGKTVEMIVPWGAGGGADVACRLVCKEVENVLGCTIVINNITGGGGSIGLAELANKNPDGLTFAYFANTDSNGNIMLEGVPYTKDSFAPVCMFASDPHVIVASKASGITDMAGLIAAGADGKTLWGIGGAWTHWDFLKLEFEAATSTSYKRLVYDGGAAVITDLMNGDCTVGTPFISEALPAIEADEVVPIAITSAERNNSCPDIPTVAEQGYAGFDSTMWRGFVAPAGTSEDVLKQFAEAVGQACQSDSLLQSAVDAGVTISFMDYDAFQTFYDENHESVKALYEANKDM